MMFISETVFALQYFRSELQERKMLEYVYILETDNTLGPLRSLTNSQVIIFNIHFTTGILIEMHWPSGCLRRPSTNSIYLSSCAYFVIRLGAGP